MKSLEPYLYISLAHNKMKKWLKNASLEKNLKNLSRWNWSIYHCEGVWEWMREVLIGILANKRIYQMIVSLNLFQEERNKIAMFIKGLKSSI